MCVFMESVQYPSCNQFNYTQKIQFNIVLIPTQCEIFQLSCLVLCLYGIPEVHALSDGLFYSLTISCN